MCKRIKIIEIGIISSEKGQSFNGWKFGYVWSRCNSFLFPLISENQASTLTGAMTGCPDFSSQNSLSNSDKQSRAQSLTKSD